MIFIIANDLHLTSYTPVGRLDDVLVASITKFSAIMELAQQYAAPVLIAGDLCERPRDWYLLPHLISILNNYNDVLVYAVRGQHDMYMRNEESANATTFGVLVETGLINLVPPEGLLHEQILTDEQAMIQGCSWGQEVPYVHDTSDFPWSEIPWHILLIHAPIAMEALWPGHIHDNIFDFISQHDGYNIICAGDVHRRFEVYHNKCMAVNTGPIIRLEADEYNMQHIPAVAVYDTETPNKIYWEALPHEPGDKVLTRHHIHERKEREIILTDFMEMVRKPRVDRTMPMIERVRTWLYTNQGTINPDVKNLMEEICGL